MKTLTGFVAGALAMTGAAQAGVVVSVTGMELQKTTALIEVLCTDRTDYRYIDWRLADGSTACTESTRDGNYSLGLVEVEAWYLAGLDIVGDVGDGSEAAYLTTDLLIMFGVSTGQYRTTTIRGLQEWGYYGQPASTPTFYLPHNEAGSRGALGLNGMLRFVLDGNDGQNFGNFRLPEGSNIALSEYLGVFEGTWLETPLPAAGWLFLAGIGLLFRRR